MWSQPEYINWFTYYLCDFSWNLHPPGPHSFWNQAPGNCFSLCTAFFILSTLLCSWNKSLVWRQHKPHPEGCHEEDVPEIQLMKMPTFVFLWSEKTLHHFQLGHVQKFLQAPYCRSVLIPLATGWAFTSWNHLVRASQWRSTKDNHLVPCLCFTGKIHWSPTIFPIGNLV